MSPTRFLVQEGRYKEFVSAFSERIAAVAVGNGLSGDTQMGPVANTRRLQAMEEFVSDARARGATVSAGGVRVGNQGYYFAPTVLSDLDPDSRILNEEPFGPIAAVVPFRDFDEAISEANRLPFGLAAYAFTASAQTANKVSRAIESGMVGINSFAISMAETPFGGVKDSGYGSEGSVEGLDAYLTTKFIAHHT